MSDLTHAFLIVRIRRLHPGIDAMPSRPAG
jgi:hypothetical protein